MNDGASQAAEEHDVIVVGAGPAGLSAAIALREEGITRVCVLDRESEAGGNPRHCAHPPFGMREYNRVLTGPTYARRMVAQARQVGIDIRVNHSVARIGEGGVLHVVHPEGVQQMRADRVILATGARETPRAARLVSGLRPLGVLTTGALQNMVNLNNLIPFRAPVIVGSELVSFSAVLTCRHAGIQPRMMIEEAPRITAWAASRALPGILGIPVLTGCRLERIVGDTQVEAVVLRLANGVEQQVACDGVLFTGQFTPEAALARMGHLALCLETGGPLIDQHGRCSDPSYFATGNMLRPVETAGWCFDEGRRIGKAVARDLSGGLPDTSDAIAVTVEPPIKYAVPQRILPGMKNRPLEKLQLRVLEVTHGELRVEQGGALLWHRRGHFLPERRILIPLAALQMTGTSPLTVTLRPG